MTSLRQRLRLPWAALSLLAAVPLLLVLQACRPPADLSPSDTPANEPWFEDVTAASGIRHTYENGRDVPALTAEGKPLPDIKDMRLQPLGAGLPRPEAKHREMAAFQSGHLAFLETIGGGAGLIDYDGDGLYDVFLVGGGTYTGPNHRTISGRPCKLYKNLGHFRFQDVTAEVGLDKIDFYTHGVAVADYNRDGWPDLLLTGWGRLALLRNDPVDPQDPAKGRKFTDVTKEAGLDNHLWSTGAAWADFDGDGHVDLYVANYVDWHFGKTDEEDKYTNPPCTYDKRTREYCSVDVFRALPHVVYRNNGDGTFRDVSKEAGLRVPRAAEDYKPLHQAYLDEARARLRGQLPPGELESAAKQAADDVCGRLRDADEHKEYGKGLTVLTVDVNGDGKPDVFVACDMADNLLYVNRSRPGRILFEEMGLSAGVSRDDIGALTGSMGSDAVDFDGSLRPSLWCVNFEYQKHSLYKNECRDGRVSFRYATEPAGIAAIGQDYVGWGTGFVDFDLDGLQDLFISNGHIFLVPIGKAKRFEKPVLMRCVENAEGRRTFKDVAAAHGGDYCAGEHAGRGVAFGDLDNDGRIDLVLTPLMQPVTVLKTVAGPGNHWIGFELKRKDHRDPVGAKVVLEAGGKKQARFAKGGGSYFSSNDPRHVFGLGQGDNIDRVTVTWPDLNTQTWEGLVIDRYWRLVEGEKEAQPLR